MKKFKLLTLLLALVVFFSTLPLTASAAASNKVVYKNDFESGKLDDSFVIQYGELNIAQENGGKYLQCSATSNKILFAYGPQEERDYDLSFRIRAATISGNTSRISALFRSPNIPAHNSVTYKVRFTSFQSSLVYADLFADENTLTSISDYDSFGLSIGLWNNVQISTRGERIIVYVNGDKLFDEVDSRYGENGGFGFYALGATIDVDDIVITRHYGKSLPEPVANERPSWAGEPGENEELDAPDTGLLRIDLTTLGQEKIPVNLAIDFIDPFTISKYTWIALGVAIIAAAGAIVGFVVLRKKSKGGKLK